MSDYKPLFNLPAVRRVVTSHNEHMGAIFSHDDALQPHSLTESGSIRPDAGFTLIHRTTGFPASQRGDASEFAIEAIARKSAQLGIVCEVVDVPPHSGTESPFFHRNQSLEYGVVLQGNVVLILGTGEEKLLGPGDVFVQRGTMHAWKNVRDEYCRFLTVIVPAEPVTDPRTGEKLGKSVMSGLSD